MSKIFKILIMSLLCFLAFVSYCHLLRVIYPSSTDVIFSHLRFARHFALLHYKSFTSGLSETVIFNSSQTQKYRK